MTTRARVLVPTVAVVDDRGAAAADAAAIAAGVPSRALMQRAGAAAAAEIARRYADRLEDGVLIATGAGNNGGDGWVVAHALHAVGIPAHVAECLPARAPDARAERERAIAAGVPMYVGAASIASSGGRLVVDALLGTGLTAGSALRGEVADAVAHMAAARERGAAIVALDLPSGIHASSGEDAGAPSCDLTITFGTIKRGHLVARAVCGVITVMDIGLGAHATTADAARLATDRWFHAAVPPIAADAHKGTRRKIAIVGGAPGMAGAVVLAARAALRSGAGLVKCVVSPGSLAAVQQAEPASLAAEWPERDDALRRTIVEWADVVLVGPGLGADALAITSRLLDAWKGPVVLDADALNAFASDLPALSAALGEREALLTPHPAEFGRLLGMGVDEVLAGRFDLPARLAAESGASVLLKGVPTVVAARGGGTVVVAEGTPLLATGGSGDVLGGIAATLLGHTGDAALAGALAAFAHGRAARAVSDRQVRGYTLDDLLAALPEVWSAAPGTPRPPVLVELPAVGET